MTSPVTESSFSGQPFKIGDANWINTLLQYWNPAGQTCGFVQMTDCILECRGDKSYATAPVRRTSVNANSDNMAFIPPHVPTDIYAKCFDPVIKVDSYTGIKQSVGDCESPAETLSIVYYRRSMSHISWPRTKRRLKHTHSKMWSALSLGQVSI